MAVKINIGDTWKDVNNIKINIGDTWKNVVAGWINIGDTWKQFWSSVPTPWYWWNFEENTGSITYDEMSSEALDLKGGATWATGHTGGYCITMDGNGDYLDIRSGVGVIYLGTSGITVTAWIKMNSTQVQIYPTIAANGATSSTVPGMWLSYRSASNYFRLTLGNGTTTYFVSSNVITSILDNTWHHFALSLDRDSATGVNFYLDGSNIGTGDLSVLSGVDLGDSGRQWCFGSRDTSTTTFFTGSMDDVRVFRTALSSDEILAIYNS